MVEDKWTLIDKKTQIASWIILLAGIIVVLAFFADVFIDQRLSSLIAILFYIIIFVCFLVIIGLILSAISKRSELRKLLKSSNKNRLKEANKKIIIYTSILLIFIMMVIWIFSLKPYDGTSIKDIENNPIEYDNKTVTIQAWYQGSIIKGSIYQEDYFTDEKYSMSVYLDEGVDKSIFIPGREYLWTGVIKTGSYLDGGLYAYMEASKIETLYEDIERHNTSRFIGSWKLIEEDYEIYTENWTWTFYGNNSLKALYISSSGYIFKDSWDRFVVDGNKFYHEYDLYFDEWSTFTHEYFGKYYFSENDTKFTLDIEDGRIIRVFQKIELL